MCNLNQIQCENYKSLMGLSLMFSNAQVVSFLICIRLFVTPGVLRCRRPKLLPVWKSTIWASGSTPSCEMSSTLPVVRKSWIQLQPHTELLVTPSAQIDLCSNQTLNNSAPNSCFGTSDPNSCGVTSKPFIRTSVLWVAVERLQLSRVWTWLAHPKK